MSDNKLIEEAGKHVPYPAIMDDAKWCIHCADEWPCVTRRLADALESRQPSEDDREALSDLLFHSEMGRKIPMNQCESAADKTADAVLAAGFSRAAVPDAATEIARNLANATSLTGQDARVIAEAAVMVAAAGEIAEDHARCDGRLLSVEKHAERMEAERDAALAAIERVRAEASLWGPILGEAKKLILAALDGAPEADKGCGTCFTCIERVVSAKPFPHNLEYPFIVCAECGNKRCPKAENHVNACTGSNEPGQPGALRYGGLPVEGESSDE